MAFQQVAEVRVEPDSQVFEHGWQSWSPAASYPVTGQSPRPSSGYAHTMGFRPETPAPTHGFQGEGLLALTLDSTGPTRIWSAPDPRRDAPSIRLTVTDGRAVVTANGPVREDVYPVAMEQALSRWADDLAVRLATSPVASIPPIWCTWYHYFRDVTEADVLENLAAIDRLGLDVGVVQIDDGYQADIGDWLERSAAFPHPLTDLIQRIRDTGRRAGIWTAPLLVGVDSQLAREHANWLVAGADAGHNWGQPLAALDITHPDAAAYLQRVFRTLAGWGFDFFKLDFLYAGALPGGRSQTVDSIAAYRQGLRLIREAVGPAATLLGCGAPLLPSIGLVDAMRVSPDTAPHVEPEQGDLSKPAQHSAIVAGRGRAFQHARWWANDPDCLIVRPEVEAREAWAAHIERYGGLRGSSDRLEALDAWGVETTRRVLKPSTTTPLTAIE